MLLLVVWLFVGFTRVLMSVLLCLFVFVLFICYTCLSDLPTCTSKAACESSKQIIKIEVPYPREY